MKINKTHIPDVVVFEPDVYGDKRGFFMETFRQDWFAELGLSPQFVQDNHSMSSFGVLRGLHLQNKNTQGKLVRVTLGEVFDVAVDMRIDSTTYGQWVGEYLSAENKKIFWVPEGFAHGFVTLEDETLFSYKCTNHYSKNHEMDLLWNDENLNIDWGIENPILSEKDKIATRFENFNSPF